ncbi:MAG: type III-B CRISPR module RAMP protein Cmr4 [Fimbriimonadia bacterium]|nr:type III-B CRISPR module RAMP protein Cmr4 [Fimbriimonadia bacterium]
MANAKAIFLHALTPVHSGTGQAVAVIDLPIAREKATGYPVIPATSLKGVLRDLLKNGNNQSWVDNAFGTVEEAGAFSFTDQRILCLPVRSYYGTFAYATCPLVLNRFKRDLAVFGDSSASLEVPNLVDDNTAMKISVTPNSVLKHGDKVYLEDLDLSANGDCSGIAQTLAAKLFSDESEKTNFQQRFALVSDATFGFLCETATEIAARISIETDTKVVKQGGLWYEEAVPAESIFHGFVMIADHCNREGVSLDNLNSGTLIQIGGNATVGRGLCRVVIP